MTKSSLERKGFIWSHFHSTIHCHSSQDRNLEAVANAEAAEEWRLLVACLACLLIDPRTVSPVVAPPIVVWALTHDY